jgi:ABC-2 type transport system ATP-binding protein
VLSETLIVVGRGRLIADTSVDEFVRRAAGEAVRVRTPEAARLRAALESLDGVTVEDDADAALMIHGLPIQAVGELAAANAVVLHELSPAQASLEDAFMRLTRVAVEYHAAPTPNSTAVGART